MSIDATRFLYISVLAACITLSYSAKKRPRPIKKISIGAIIIILSLLSGLRASSVGIDTQAYYDSFLLLGNRLFDQVYFREKSFEFICFILMKIFIKPVWLFVIFSFIINGLIILRFWSMREKTDFTIAVFAYYCLLYFITFNLMRQFIAVAIVFWATKYLEKTSLKNNFKYFLSLGIAALFHYTAILGIIILIINGLSLQNSLRKRNQTIRVLILLLPFILMFSLMIFNQYKGYLHNTQFDFSPLLIVKIVFLFLIHNQYLLKTARDKELNLYPDKNYVSSYAAYYLIGILITCVGTFYRYADRLGLYFMIFEPVFMAMSVKYFQNSTLCKIGAATISLFIFINILLNISTGGSKLQYYFFWQV